MKIEDKIDQYLNEVSNEERLLQWADTFAENHGGKTPDDEGWHELCVLHMEDNIDDPDAYCARVRDIWKGKTTWRGKGKMEK